MVFMLCLRECDPSYSRSSIANILFVNYESSVNEYDSNLFWCETLNINHWSYENGLCTCCISSLCPYLQTIVELQGMLQNASEQCYYFILFCVVDLSGVIPIYDLQFCIDMLFISCPFQRCDCGALRMERFVQQSSRACLRVGW